MITLERVSKHYRSGPARVPVLREVSFRIEPGEFVAIMGASGSGKSTLLNILGLLDDYDSGHYLLAGNDTRALGDRRASELRNRLLGFVFQAFHLVPQKTAWENVALPLAYQGVSRRERRRRALELLARLGLTERAHHRPHELSGGQRQRVAIARALITDPKVILADEPTGNLDSESSREVMALLREIWAKDRTLVLVTHAREIAQAAPRVIHVRDGLLVEARGSAREQSIGEARATGEPPANPGASFLEHRQEPAS
jgi:putative ABC transport system ATP-binding protein